jgi:hypothetical protein
MENLLCAKSQTLEIQGCIKKKNKSDASMKLTFGEVGSENKEVAI